MKRSTTYHLLVGLTRILFYLLIASAALIYSFGYKINWRTGTIQQTGIIYLKSSTSISQAYISVNGKQQADRLPYRMTGLLPGYYSVEVKRPGYQTWSRQVLVEANKVSSFPYLFLVYEHPVSIGFNASDFNGIESQKHDSQGIDVRYNNELYLKVEGEWKYVDRFQNDINLAIWHPDGIHIILQIGKQLTMVEYSKDRPLLTFPIVTLDKEKPAQLDFHDGGRVILYQQDDERGALALYDPSTVLPVLFP